MQSSQTMGTDRFVFSPALAQQIAGETTEAIGYNVIITDAHGIVIGSGDAQRVGSLHEASLEVVRTQELAWHTPEQARAMQGTRPGITLPLLIAGQAAGTVGITGSPQQVRRFGLVVRRQTEILLEHSALMRSRFLRERALEDLITEIAAFDPELVERELLVSTARDLGFNLLLPRVILLLEVRVAPIGPELLRTMRGVFNHPEDIVAVRSATRCIVLAHSDSDDPGQPNAHADRVLSLVHERFGINARIAISEPAVAIEQLRSGCKDVADALWLGARVSPEATLLQISHLRSHQALSGIPHRIRERFVETVVGSMSAVPDWDDLRSTVIAWCENGFNLVAAADSLHIHRNTLVYRLEKVERLVGRPWRDHRAMLSLYMASLAEQLEPVHSDEADQPPS